MSQASSSALRRQQVTEILALLDASVPQLEIAEKYKISKKTVNRIFTGETWSSVSGRKPTKPEIVRGLPMPEHVIVDPEQRAALLSAAPEELTEYMAVAPKEFKDFLDWIVGVKNAYGFSFDRPICWGWYEWYDGLHAIATDMEIAWEGKDLVDYAQNAVSYDCPYSPVFSNEAHELPTFALEYLMNRPIGEPLTKVSDTGSMTTYTTVTGNLVVLRKKYVILAEKHKLEVREATGHSDFVYLTKNKSRSTADTSATVIAAVVTLSPKQAQSETTVFPMDANRKNIRSA